MFFTCHWQHRYWNDDNPEGVPLRAAGSNRFSERGVCGGQGHLVYVITLGDGYLYLGGRMKVSRVVSRSDAVRITRTDSLYDADEWVIDDDGGTPLHLHRRLAPEVTRCIQCVMADGSHKGLCFRDRICLDIQATRGVRRLTGESARLLDHIIATTDQMPRTGRLLTVTLNMIGPVRQI